MTVSVFHQRITYNSKQHVILLNFEKLHLKDRSEFLALSNILTKILEQIVKAGGRVDCLVNYDNMEIHESIWESYIQMCIINTHKYFKQVSRYGGKDLTVLKMLEDAFNQKKAIPPNIYEETIGNYLLRETLGHGTFGIVKMGLSKTTGQKFAVKVLEKEMIREVSALEILGREVSIHSKLDHPNIVKLFDSIETETHMYLVLELLSGGRLESKIEYASIEEQHAKKLFRQLLDAVEYLHNHHITHRDLHPGNIMISEDQQSVKLIDFGCADEFTDDTTRFTEFYGKSVYACPEMLTHQDRSYRGIDADLWSLAVILFKMVTGYEPFRFFPSYNGETIFNSD